MLVSSFGHFNGSFCSSNILIMVKCVLENLIIRNRFGWWFYEWVMPKFPILNVVFCNVSTWVKWPVFVVNATLDQMKAFGILNHVSLTHFEVWVMIFKSFRPAGKLQAEYQKYPTAAQWECFHPTAAQWGSLVVCFSNFPLRRSGRCTLPLRRSGGLYKNKKKTLIFLKWVWVLSSGIKAVV